MPRVLVVLHRHGSLERPRYFLSLFLEFWRKWGIEVEMVRGPGPFVQADAAIQHIDLTVLPKDHMAFLRRYRVVINGAAADISKHRVSRNLLRRGDRYEGPVIIKTNHNCGGAPEAHLAGRRSIAHRWMRSLRKRLPWTLRSTLPSSAYPMFPSVGDVPRAVWMNPSFVVERFVPERRDGLYCLRSWVFFGDRERHSLLLSKEPIIKAANVVRREPAPPAPAELRQIRRELGIDYGKLDYGIVDGKPILYDANTTPAVATGSSVEDYRPHLESLAEGIWSFLKRPTELAFTVGSRVKKPADRSPPVLSRGERI